MRQLKFPTIHCIPAQLKRPQNRHYSVLGSSYLKIEVSKTGRQALFLEIHAFCNENARNQADSCLFLLSTRRKPTKYILLSNFPPKRCVRRHQPGSLTTEPPRITRKPSGFFTSHTGFSCSWAEYWPYQSAHHSSTLPVISYSPRPLGFLVPTIMTLLSALA